MAAIFPTSFNIVDLDESLLPTGHIQVGTSYLVSQLLDNWLLQDIISVFICLAFTEETVATGSFFKEWKEQIW